MVFAAACRYYQSKQALEIGKVKEAGVLSLKASELISAVNPTNEHCKKLSGKISTFDLLSDWLKNWLMSTNLKSFLSKNGSIDSIKLCSDPSCHFIATNGH